MGIGQIKMHFELFLLEHQVLDEYYTYLKRGEPVPIFFEANCPCVWIDGGFVWSQTAEGSDFWYELNNKWLDICEEEGYEY